MSDLSSDSEIDWAEDITLDQINEENKEQDKFRRASNMNESAPWVTLEVAKSNLTTCQECKQQILKGNPKVNVVSCIYKQTMFRGVRLRRHHVECFSFYQYITNWASLDTRRTKQEENTNLMEIKLFIENYRLTPKPKRDKDGRIIWDRDEEGQIMKKEKKEQWRLRLIKIKDPMAFQMKPTIEDIMQTPPDRVMARLSGFDEFSEDQKQHLIEWYIRTMKDKMWFEEVKEVDEDMAAEEAEEEAIRMRHQEEEIAKAKAEEDAKNQMDDDNASTTGSTAETVDSTMRNMTGQQMNNQTDIVGTANVQIQREYNEDEEAANIVKGMQDCPINQQKSVIGGVRDSNPYGKIEPGKWPHPDDPKFRKGVTCFKCQREGHYASECPDRQVSFTSSTGTDGDTKREWRPHWNKWGRFKSKEKRSEDALKAKLNQANFGHLEPTRVEELPQLYMEDLGVTNQGPPPIVDAKAKQRFAAACRAVVFRQCNAYKHKQFDRVEEGDGLAICPILKFLQKKKICVTRDAVHVHHAYPYDFKDIVEMFMDENYMVLHEYSDPQNAADDQQRDRMNLEAMQATNQNAYGGDAAVNPNKIVTIEMKESRFQTVKNNQLVKQRDQTALNAIEYEFGEFKEEELRKKFAEFHASKARLLLVHPEANLSQLKHKNNRDLGRCGVCRKVDHLILVETFNGGSFHKPVCQPCKDSLGVCAACNEVLPVNFLEKYENDLCTLCSKKTFCSLSEVMNIFGLTKKEDLKGLTMRKTMNPINKGYAKMKLFEQSKVIEYCLNKFESPEKIEEYWALKRKRGAQMLANRKDWKPIWKEIAEGSSVIGAMKQRRRDQTRMQGIIEFQFDDEDQDDIMLDYDIDRFKKQPKRSRHRKPLTEEQLAFKSKLKQGRNEFFKDKKKYRLGCLLHRIKQADNKKKGVVEVKKEIAERLPTIPRYIINAIALEVSVKQELEEKKKLLEQEALNEQAEQEQQLKMLEANDTTGDTTTGTGDGTTKDFSRNEDVD